MKKNILFSLLVFSLGLGACKKDFGDLNNAVIQDFTSNASIGQLNNLVSGTESGLRTNVALYLDDCGTLGRELYHFSNSEPRYVTDMLGGGGATLSNSNFYITNPWASRYQVVKNCNILIEAATNSKQITAQEKAGYIGFGQLIKAYQLLLCLNLTDTNGIRINVADPDHLGPFVNYSDGIAAIAALLDSAQTALAAATIDYSLAGFGSYATASGLVKVDRALAARVDVYRGLWSQALTDLQGSFWDPTGSSLTDGVYHVFSTGSGDQLNTFFVPQNTTGDTRVAHPSFAADILPNDNRIGKATLRLGAGTASLNGLSSDRDVWVYTSNTAAIPIIRNEELILIGAEANIQLTNYSDAANALNVIRAAHGLAAYGGAMTAPALTAEMLYERRYSLYCEGHRWIDMRRYGMLGALPEDRPGDQVWGQFPIPVSEQQ
jgi:hypothetical protein